MAHGYGYRAITPEERKKIEEKNEITKKREKEKRKSFWEKFWGL
jgi:hypothetical protein